MSETLYVKRGRRYLKWSELDDRVRSEDAKRIARLTAEVKRLQAVVEAARKAEAAIRAEMMAGVASKSLSDAGFLLNHSLRALDGEP